MGGRASDFPSGTGRDHGALSADAEGANGDAGAAADMAGDFEGFGDGFADSLEDAVEIGAREHYADPLLYDYEYRRRRADVNFYRGLLSELLQGPGRVLELACGSGRVTTGLLRAGHEVIGLDLSRPMLERAHARISRLGRAARARSALVCADIRDFLLGARFPAVLMAFNAFEHLYTHAEASACLARVRAHLEPGGRLIFDVQNPDLRWLMRDPEHRWARTKFTHPRTGERMVYSTNHDYDPINQIVFIRLYYDPVPGSDAVPQVVTLSQRKFFPAELAGLLEANGFALEARYGDFHGNPLDGDSTTQVIVCTPR
ncbi:class I SAM-dependent methyltransferase [Haliangium ochraceum]|uniref:Methyltransferase type 12 n=1 Tax=Haliangium ochraceum (strain DSM 14365 / JCM 11303 / SMP-2) TaxID=502025 RepID=D0LK18_HALO1|nr:class I SAM-dependent methyltransferase [Haliangium ochraceum]ACY18525.1 Methyltransferase type 12 [Haliangium ochraceum DSM 14365]